jgi:integrase
MRFLPAKNDADTDAHIDALMDFAADTPTMFGIYWDKQVKGLRIYIGKRKATWQFFSDTTKRGDRRHTFKTLGHFDRPVFGGVVRGTGIEPRPYRAEWHMTTAMARTQAQIMRGHVLEGTPPTNARAGIKFGPDEASGKRGAFEAYCQYLERKAEGNGKPARWARNVRSLGSKYLLPQFGNWTLEQMVSEDGPGLIADYLLTIRSAVTANHCARVLSAVYTFHRKRNTTLPRDKTPAQAHEKRKPRGEKKGMVRRDFPKWFEAWQRIENPVRKAFHLCNLLTGARPGELARVTHDDIDDDANVLVIGNAKAGNAIEIPLTPEIREAINMAGPKGKADTLIFPGCNNIAGGKFRGQLPFKGHALRRTYRTFAADECKIPDDICEHLLGHIPQGIRANYLPTWMRKHGSAIIEAQHKISREMMAALAGGARAKRKRAA